MEYSDLKNEGINHDLIRNVIFSSMARLEITKEKYKSWIFLRFRPQQTVENIKI